MKQKDVNKSLDEINNVAKILVEYRRNKAKENQTDGKETSMKDIKPFKIGPGI